MLKKIFGPRLICCLLLVIAMPAHAITECEDFLDHYDRLIKESSIPINPLTSFRNLTPEALLPASYLVRLKQIYGFVEIRHIDSSEYGGGVLIMVTAGESATPIITFSVRPNGTSAEIVNIDKLRLEDPLNETSKKLGLAQRRKGLPPDVAQFFFTALKESALQSGFKTLEADAVENFSVLMLYMRKFAMVPATPLARETISYLTSLYNYASRQLPTGYRTKSLDAFSAVIGSNGYQNHPRYVAIARLWKRYLNGKIPLPNGYRLLHDSHGKLIGFVDEGSFNPFDVTNVFFLDPGTSELYNYAAITLAGRTQLHLSLVEEPDGAKE